MTLARSLTRSLLAAIGLLTVIALALGVVAVLIMPSLLQVEDEIERADYILPLAGGWHRYMKAAELYKAGFARKILLANAKLGEPSRFQKLRAEMGVPKISRRELRQRLFAHLEVPDEALVTFGDGLISTIEEAEALRDFLKARPARIILVTSAAHSRRAKLIFEDAYREATFMITSPPEQRLARRWWRNQKSAQWVVAESFKLAWYLLGGRFRSTPN